MPKQLLDPHFIAVVLFMLIVGAAWFIGRVDTETALPLLALAAGVGVGANALRQGVNIGVPLQQSAPGQNTGEQVHS